MAAIRLRRTKPLLSSLAIPNAAAPCIHSSSHPPIASSTASDLPPLSADDEAVVSSAVSILRELRSKRRWTFLKSVHNPVGFSPAQFAHVLLRLRNHPRLALGFFVFSRRYSLCRHDHLSFAAAAHVLARNRRRSEALSIIQTAVRTLDPSSSSSAAGEGDPPEIFRTLARIYRAFDSAPFVFDLLVQAYLQAKRTGRAIQIVRILRSRGIQPSIGTSNALIRSVSRANGSDAAFQLYNQIFKPEAGCDGVSVKVRVSPNVGTFNTLLLALYREGNMEKSVEIREEMETRGCNPNVFTHSILMAGLCDEGMMDDASRLWEEMVGRGIEPDIMAFNTMISGYCRIGEMESAEQLYRQMTLSEIEPTATTFEHLIQGHCKVGGIDSGLLLYRDMRRRGFGLEVSVADELLAALCERNKVREGLRILRDEMRREGFAPSRRSYEVLIRGLCEEGEVEEALKLQAEMAGKGFGNSFEVYNAFIQGYRKQGNTEKMERLKDEMIAVGVKMEE
ncbi:hypothetical protein Cni_G00366 [Canna indica]|uniref:Pentatricopeptide repeat-containing protein n=1 Tax=Canna indica TaxID=4628 RepID=A0AAQ3PZC3_9LILI|nr:hypothetical protein Cni_G00366 [Canna indica]